MTIPLIARRPVVYHGRTCHPGDRFDALPVDALVLTSSRAATFATGREVQFTSMPPVRDARDVDQDKHTGRRNMRWRTRMAWPSMRCSRTKRRATSANVSWRGRGVAVAI
jgi:hypothetical protein